MKLTAPPVVFKLGRVTGRGAHVASFGDELACSAPSVGRAGGTIAVFPLGDENHLLFRVLRRLRKSIEAGQTSSIPGWEVPV